MLALEMYSVDFGGVFIDLKKICIWLGSTCIGLNSNVYVPLLITAQHLSIQMVIASFCLRQQPIAAINTCCLHKKNSDACISADIFIHFEISLGWGIYTPRPSRLPSSNLLGLGLQNPYPQEICWSSGDVFPNTSLLSAVCGYNISCLQKLPEVVGQKVGTHASGVCSNCILP